LLAAASQSQAQAPAADNEDYPEACSTIGHCIARLSGEAGDRGSLAPALIGQRLAQHGRAGADALVPLLDHASEEVRRLAEIALDQFEELQPRHAPALIAAHRRRLDVASAIARTGSEEALRYLESKWSVDDGAHDVRDALPLFGERAAPFLLRELERCRQGCSRREAGALLYALGRIDGPLPNAARAVIRDVAASESADPELREEMEDQLILRFDRAALPILVRRLEAARGDDDEEWVAARLIDSIQHHREAARRTAGPLVRSYLSRPELRQARIEAVITSLVIEDRLAIPALRALLGEGERDWLATYHALWALAELDALEARPAIARVARDHWYLPVRNNARRALNMLNGGGFELPELADEDQRGGYAGELNFRADLDAERDCRLERPSEVRQAGRSAPIRQEWPSDGAVRIALEEPTRQARELLPDVQGFSYHALVTLDWQHDGERIVGVDADQWNGGLFAIDSNGGVRRLLDQNVIATFDSGGSLLVFTSNGAGFHAGGDLWRLQAGGPATVAGGPVRLPARPTGFAVASDRSLLVRTERGDLAVTPAGRLRSPRPCARAPTPQ